MSFGWESPKSRPAVDPQPGAAASAVGKRTLVQRLEQAMAQRPEREAAPVAAVAQRGLAGPAQPLPHLDRIQALFGRHDVRGVHAHVGGPAADAADEMGAQAYAMGSSVAFAGAPDLHTAAHEAAHVVQQRAGVHLAGGVGEAGDPYERHADAVADLVVQGKSAAALLDRHAGGAGGGGGAPAVQHRTVASSVYDNFDEGAALQPTKDMIAAGHREEEAAALFAEAIALNQQLQGLRADPLVRADADPQDGAIQGHLVTTRNGNNLMTAFVDRIVAAYTGVLTPEQLRKCNPTGGKAAERLAAKRDARVATVKLLQDAIEKLVTQTVVMIGKSTAAVAAMRGIVAPIQAKADALHAGKHTYEASVAARDLSVHDNVAVRAAQVGVPVPDTGPAFATAKGHADLGQWVEAGQHAGPARGQLDAMRSKVEKAEKNRRIYQDAQSDMAALRQLRSRFADLHIEATELNAALADAETARLAYSTEDWDAAATAARRATAPLAELQQLVVEFQAYRTDDKLLIGTITEVHRQLPAGPLRNQRALDSLKATYAAQCAATRENWLIHLDIAGTAIVGPDSCHYTTFNDAIPQMVTLSVETYSVDELCDKLFKAVGTFGQLHATRVVGGVRYHLYWDGTYSNNVITSDLENTDSVAFAELRAEHAVMKRTMTARVKKAKDDHGRIAHNSRGQQNQIIVF